MEMTARRLTLASTLSAGLLGLALAVSLLLALLLQRWGDSLLAASERLREAASRSAEAKVTRTLTGAEASLRSVEGQMRTGAVDAGDPYSVERALFGQLLANPDLAEVTLTRNGKPAADGRARAGDLGPWQISVFREGGPFRILTRYTHRAGRGFVADERAHSPHFQSAPFARLAERTDDPTQHLTFASTVEHQKFSADPLWTDLHYAEADARLPEDKRRILVTVMKAVEDDAGRFAGVVRVGLIADRLDEVSRIRVDESDPRDPHRVLLADAQGRSIIRERPDQHFEDQDGDLRPSARMLSEETRAALAQPAVRGASPQNPRLSGRFDVRGRTFLVSALYLESTQGWRVAIVVPEDHYLGDLQRTRAWLLVASLGALGLLVLLGALTLGSVRRSLGRMVASATRMRNFDFAPSAVVSSFRDVAGVMEDLEQAKTALRAMGKYVPIDLVRQLYKARQEPQLGGERRDVTLMFTDIEGFTTISERLGSDQLALALGRYLEAMTAAVHASGGTVDKYIGDGVMAFWNAPEPRDDHASRACAAALACVDATNKLFASPDWGGLPSFRTRFGLHRDEVQVGHFGAPDRISYTALGDGVNLASRLEGLNKVYGTTILASQTVRDGALHGFAFRLVDLVAVKGKTHGIAVYELLGKSDQIGSLETYRSYERALELYRHRRFAEALDLVAAREDDPPSRVLVERCRRFLREPPPESWDGTYVAHEK